MYTLIFVIFANGALTSFEVKAPSEKACVSMATALTQDTVQSGAQVIIRRCFPLN